MISNLQTRLIHYRFHTLPHSTCVNEQYKSLKCQAVGLRSNNFISFLSFITAGIHSSDFAIHNYCCFQSVTNRYTQERTGTIGIIRIFLAKFGDWNTEIRRIGKMMMMEMEEKAGKKLEVEVMEGERENERPPNPLGGNIRQSFNNNCRSSPSPLVRHSSLMTKGALKNKEALASDFKPCLRSGICSDKGTRENMEDAHVCIRDLAEQYGHISVGQSAISFYGVFDGHGGKDAAHFVRDNLPRLLVENSDFPLEMEKAVRKSFLEADNAFAEACLLHTCFSSGTTALAAIISGRTLLVANAGDCRAVLSRRGRALEMSRDHRPCCVKERKRIEGSGGYVDDGYLNGQLNITRALGDWHLEDLKKSLGGGPLSAEPELKRITLVKEDEFLIIGSDGLWEVFTSQNAVDFARRRLQEHNDPEACSRDLIDEAMKRKTSDNLTALTVCFHSEAPPNLAVNKSRVQRSISAEGLRSLQGYLDSLRE